MLVVWVVLCLLGLALGAWFGEASGRDRWIDDDRQANSRIDLAPPSGEAAESVRQAAARIAVT